jgi:hypothetical protein
MNMNLTQIVRRGFAALVGVAAAFPALAQQIHYPDAVLANPSQLSFPWYTPGAGTGGQTVRVQWLCPSTFLANQGLSAGLVTKLGFSLAGQAAYDVLEVRVGVSSVTSLGSDWLVNLPDQRLQRDLANVVLPGGGTSSLPINQWVDYDLDFPFYWQPGDAVVVDIITRASTSGAIVGTTVGTGVVTRAYNFNYSAGALATNFTGWGGKFRLQFADTSLVTYGAGCAGSAGVAPVLSSSGDAALGNTMILLADLTVPTGFGGFLFGFSRTSFAAGSLPAALGGGCSVLVSPELFEPVVIGPGSVGFGSAGYALIVPFTPSLRGTVLHTQFLQADMGSPAIVPLTFSGGGAIVIY